MKSQDMLAIAIIFILVTAFFTLVGAAITLFIWNIAIAPLFHISTITLVQAIAINIILQILKAILWGK